MKKFISILLIILMVAGLTACKDNTNSNTDNNSSQAASSDKPQSVSDINSTSAVADSEAEISDAPSSDAAVSDVSSSEEIASDVSSDVAESTAEIAQPENPAENKKVLVVVFSATGTTKGVAEKIAAIEDADLYEIKAAQEYTSADLNWNDSDSRSTKEQNDKSARPAIGSEPISLDGYDTVYIGYPIWWGEEPRIMDSFVESYSFDGMTMIPFCTSGGSGIGRSGKNLEENAGSGNWLDGQRFSGSVSESELKSWIDGLK